MPELRPPHPKTYNGDLADPPQALAPLCLKRNWLVWKWARKNGAWTKPPFRADNPGRHASNNDPATWASRHDAVAAVLAGKADGIGFSLFDTDIGAADLDHCRDAVTGKIDRWAQAIIDRAPGAYVEITVSGTGLRIIGTTNGPAVHTNFKIAGRDGARIELYRKAVRYITVSGVEVGRCTKLPNIDTLIDGIIAEQANSASTEGESEGGNGFDAASIIVDDIDAIIQNGVPDGQRSEAFARCVWSLAGQGLSQDEIEEELARYPDGIGSKYAKRLHNEIERCFSKWQTTQGAQPSGQGTASHNWQDPDWSILDDRRGELPDFPIDVLSQSWTDWVTKAAHGAGVTVAHVMIPLFGIASSLIGTARRVKASKSWSEPFTMWTAVVGFSGTGKTPGLDVTKRALSKIERDRKARIDKLRRQHESNTERARASYKNWKSAVEDAVEKGLPAPPMPDDANVPDEFIAPRLYVSNSTIEKIAVLLLARPRGMLMICDELASLFLNLSRYSGGTDREFWLEAWNGKHYVVERMGRAAVAVDHLLVGMTGGFQPDKLARSFQGDADGLYTRICFGWPAEPDYKVLTDDTEEVEPEFENALVRLIDLPCEEDGQLIISSVNLSPEARQAFEQFRHFAHLEKVGFDGREREWWAKSPAHVLRLAGTLCYLDWARRTAGSPFLAQEPNYIDACFITAAVRLVRDYFWPHSRAALRQVGLSPRHANARRVLRWLQKNHTDEVSREDVRRDALGQSLDADQTQALIDRLVSAGWLRQVTTLTPGRARHRWTVNAKLFSKSTAGSAESAGSHVA